MKYCIHVVVFMKVSRILSPSVCLSVSASVCESVTLIQLVGTHSIVLTIRRISESQDEMQREEDLEKSPFALRNQLNVC